MKLIRYGEPGREKTGIVLSGRCYDTSALGLDYNESFFEQDGLEKLRQFAEMNNLPELPGDIRLGPPVARPSKIVCIGLNYADHARETGATPPPEPVIFLKSTSALVGPNDDIMIPRDSQKTDWEVELAVVIGRRARYVTEQQARAHIAGYCLHNDVSEREFQLERSGTWDKGKGCDTFAPIGPWLATPDELPGIGNLRLWLSVNGKIMQDGTTANLIFNIPFLVAYTSRFMTLLPGDIISTGTPAGVGMGMKPSQYLRPGDIVELGIDGLGSARQKVVAFKE
ncbi:MAG: fumarylacetoacetate hydrolase family protein [Bacteroidota bacterium]|nr:fumarylacetoacetate hydrolase family protein [Bacteroidota bacterium]MDP4214994.1 fumarylacetoacetate hydrolase family protein [Bacteroidota bacterium]MDP4244259.1 fumarylacetoacetate hydrolase family protein [Bacteroidota bacterium]MDP4255622.1 fumarylacetoacetate hydrolase family protein [Bacteroidota bacterium]MDP4256994.1 fumarylacetoacetate hydrolase family protein [Bacteroidota bacterium]